MYGGDRCRVACACGLDLQCVIRKKFRGRHRRGNVVTVGCYVLVGLRDYEAPNHRLCDLLEVYSRTRPTASTARRHRHRRVERCAAAHNPAMGRAGRGGGGLSSAHVVSNAAHADGARARADSRVEGLSEGLHGTRLRHDDI
jgi:hypothetical protein